MSGPPYGPGNPPPTYDPYSSVYFPTNPGWGNAATVAKTKKPPKKAIPRVIPQTKASIEAEAQAMVDKIFGPQTKLLKDAYDNRNRNIADAYAAAAALAGGIAPAVSKTYQDAGAQQAGFAQGFTGAAGQVAQQETGAQNAALANLGSPQTVTSGLLPGAGGGDAIYATGGYIPGSTFSQQGAGFTAAAQQLPYTSRALGTEAQVSAGNDYLKSVKELAANQPEVFQTILDKLQASKAAGAKAAYDQWLDGKKLLLKKYEDDLNFKVANHQLDLKEAQDEYKRLSDDYDRKHPAPVLRTDGDGKTLIYDPATGLYTTIGTARPPKPPKPPTANTKINGLTPGQYSTNQQKAQDKIEGWYGGVEKDGVTVSAPITYQQVINRLTRQYKLKLVDAQSMANQYWTQRGHDGRPPVTYQERTALRKAGVPQSQIAKVQKLYNLAAGEKNPDAQARMYAEADAALNALLGRIGG